MDLVPDGRTSQEPEAPAPRKSVVQNAALIAVNFLSKLKIRQQRHILLMAADLLTVFLFTVTSGHISAHPAPPNSSKP